MPRMNTRNFRRIASLALCALALVGLVLLGLGATSAQETASKPNEAGTVDAKDFRARIIATLTERDVRKVEFEGDRIGYLESVKLRWSTGVNPDQIDDALEDCRKTAHVLHEKEFELADLEKEYQSIK